MNLILRTMAAAALAAVSVNGAAQALPDTSAELLELINADYGGDPNAYVEAEFRGDYRTLGCRGRTDLLQALLDAGLKLEDVPPAGTSNMLRCAYGRGHLDVFRLGLTPEGLRTYENYKAQSVDDASLLNQTVWDNDYAFTLALLENGTSLFNASDGAYVALTREGQYLRVAIVAQEKNFRNVTRALKEAGYGDIVEDARRPGIKKAFFNARIAWADHIDAYNPTVLDRMIRGASKSGLADLAIGAAVGGDVGAILSVAGAAEMALGDAPSAVEDSGFDFSRYLRGYQSAAAISAEAEQGSPAEAGGDATSTLVQLEQLADLRDRGAITKEEFDLFKRRILDAEFED
ncbi:MAG: SHOCT domain-containing protein [Aquisalinus sp.]|nr:SHOCT domain-containing protein [Aquisalinus sp.]